MIGDSYARRVVGSSRTVVDGIEMSPVLASNDSVRILDNAAVPTPIQQRPDSATFSAVDNVAPGEQSRIVAFQGNNRWHQDFYGVPGFSFLQSPAGQAAGQKYNSSRFGAGVSGPIPLGTSHLTAQYLGQRQNVERQLVGYVPSSSYSAHVQAAEPRLDSILAAYPKPPHSASSSPTAVFDSVGSQSASADIAMLRLDHSFRPRDRSLPSDTLFARFNMSFYESEAPLSGGQGYLRDTSTTHLRPFAAIAGWTHSFTPSLSQDLRAAWLHTEIENHVYSPFRSAYAVSIPGLTSLSGNQQTFAASDAYVLQDGLALTRGRHTLQAGAEVRRVQLDMHSSDSGHVNFASLTDFSANQVNWATYSQPLSSNTLLEWQTFAWLQDNWRMKKNLLIGAGLRYEFYNRPHENENKAIPFDFATCGAAGYCAPGASFNRLNPLNLDPRASAAWTPTLGPAWLRNSVLRAGAAVFHSNGLLMDQSPPVFNEVENFYVSSSEAPALSYPVAPYLTSTSAGVASPRGMSRDRSNPYALEWSASLQTQLTPRWILTNTYFGADGFHLPASTYINLLDPASARRPHPAYGQISWFDNTSSSNVHAYALTSTYNAPHGLQLMGGYNWAHQIDNGADDDIGADPPQNPACPSCDRASGDADIRHLGGLRSYFPLRFGEFTSGTHPGLLSHAVSNWTLLNDFYGTSPLPLNVTIDRAVSQVATGYTIRQRPDRVPGVSLTPPGGRTINNWINPAAFTTVHGLYGTAPRNIARGPELWALSSGLQRQLSLPKSFHARIQVRSSNVLNHANYAQPFADWSSNQFGKILNPYAPQFGGDMGPRSFSLDLSFWR